jgi:CheY-like chemotaxis protein
MLGLYARPQSPLDAGAGVGTALDGTPGESATVLVVADDPALRALLLELLGGEDYRVLVAGEGRTGLALVRQHCPHAILLDIGPPGISVWAVLQQLRASGRTRHIPVVALTGRSELAADAGGQAPDACVAKPFDIATLLEHLARAVQSGRRLRSLGAGGS